MPWQILSGVVEWWADEGLREVGRNRRALDAGTTPQAQRIARGTLSIARAAFIAQREPWRLTEVTLLDVPESTAPTIASWADEATAVLRKKPAEQHFVAPNETWGDLCVGVMLKPDALHQLVPEPWPERFAVDGPLLERDPALLPELLSWSTDRYEVVFDPSREILTNWTAIIDGEVAQRITLARLTALDS
jgi:hypothetical protein